MTEDRSSDLPNRGEILSSALGRLKHHATEGGAPLTEEQIDILRNLIEPFLTEGKEQFPVSAPPDWSDTTATITTITPGGGTGQSEWIGYIRFNLKEAFNGLKAFKPFMKGSLTPWDILFAIPTAMMALRSATEIPLGDHEASVLYVMYLYANEWHEIISEGLFEKINEVRERQGRDELSKVDYQNATKYLEKYLIIHPINDPQGWYIRDEIQIKLG